MAVLEGLQQALTKAAEQTSKQGAEQPAAEVSKGDSDRMKDLMSNIDKDLSQAEQTTQAQMQEVSKLNETGVADDNSKSMGGKILDQLEKQQAKVNEARVELTDLADKIASGENVDPSTMLQLQTKVFEVQHTTEMASKAGGQLSEDLKKLQSGQ